MTIQLVISSVDSTDLTDITDRFDSLLDLIGEYALNQIGSGWDSGRDPMGIPWAPLKPSTLEGRRRRNIQGIKPLIATGKMRSSLRLVRDGNSVRLLIDKPGGYHQTGTKNMVARPLFPGGGSLDGFATMPPSWERDIEGFIRMTFQ